MSRRIDCSACFAPRLTRSKVKSKSTSSEFSSPALLLHLPQLILSLHFFLSCLPLCLGCIRPSAPCFFLHGFRVIFGAEEDLPGAIWARLCL